MIRPYLKSDKQKVIELLKLNTPDFFEESEEQIFNNYLLNKTEDYFVIEKDNHIIGAGGINYFLNEQLARLAWDIIHPNFQGNGLGKQLVNFRLNKIQDKPSINHVIVRTTQLVTNFYAKQGFKLIEIKKDYWAKGFDLYEMKFNL